MNILFLLPRYHTNHIEIIKSHLSLNHKVDIHVKTYGKVEDHKLLQPTIFDESIVTRLIKKILKIKMKNNSFYLPKLIKYFFYLKKKNYDIAIIRVHGLLYTYLISLLLKLNKINIIYYQQTNMNLKFLEKNKFINIRKIDFYFRLKFFNAKWITPLKDEKFISTKKNIFYLPFVVKSNLQKLNFDSFNIITIGKFEKRKNHIFLIKGLQKFFKKYNVKLTIVGENSTNEHQKNLEEIYNYNKNHKLENYIKIITNINHQYMDAIYKKHNIFILSSIKEPASISLLEALGNGLPSFCPDDCGTKTYISENYNGAIFKSNDIISLQQKLEKIFLNINLLQIMSENAFKYANDNISSNNYIKYFNEIIRHK